MRSASSSGISMSNSSSIAITSSTMSSESAPRSSMKEASGLISSMLTPSCSTISSETLVSSATIPDPPLATRCVCLARSCGEICRVIELLRNAEAGAREVARHPGDQAHEHAARPDLEHARDARGAQELHHLGEPYRRGHLLLEQGGESRRIAACVGLDI